VAGGEKRTCGRLSRLHCLLILFKVASRFTTHDGLLAYETCDI
jgi:hypothetical protein